MVPHVFVSSTVRDLGHLREAIRETVLELGYVPVMSEFGDVGYLPTISAEEACYQALRQCQLAIFVIGKRYGSPSAGNLSVTHNEFRAARDQSVPTICLVDQEVLIYKQVYDANASGTVAFPSMEQSAEVFTFIQEIATSKVNNAILSYAHVADARAHLKTQVAHFVGDLLRRLRDPIAAEVKDILSEVKTLRHELTKTSVDMERAQRFMRAIRVLLEDCLQDLRQVIEYVKGSLEEGVPILLESQDFSDFIQRCLGQPPEVIVDPPSQNDTDRLRAYSTAHWKVVRSNAGQAFLPGFWALRQPQRGVVVTQRALEDFDKMFASVQRVSRGVTDDPLFPSLGPRS